MTKYYAFFKRVIYLLEHDSKMDKETTLKILEELEVCLDWRSSKRHGHFIEEIKKCSLKYLSLVQFHDDAIVFDLLQELNKLKITS